MLNRVDRGWASLDVGIALIVIISLFIFGANSASDYITTKENKIIAQHTSQFGSAAKQYIKKNYNSLYDATAGGAVNVTAESLKNAGLLPEGFSKKNSYGQDYEIKVVRNKKDSTLLDALLITSGGSPFSFKSMSQISKDISGLGGYIDNPAFATGAMNNWQMTLSDFGLTSTKGHLAVALTADVLDSVNQESDRLYRFAVNGRPELNQMKTSIDMASNNLNNVNTLNASTGHVTGNVSAGSANIAGNMTSSSANVNGNITSGSANVNGNITAGSANVNGSANISGNLGVSGTGSFNGSIYTNGSVITYGNNGWTNGTYGGGFYMSDNDWVRVLNNKNIYTAGQIRGGSVRSDGRLSTGEVLQLDGVSGEGGGCSPNGLISRDGSGAILSCVNGAWAKSGVGRPGYYCRHTSMSKGKSDDYVGYTPRTDRTCGVISPGMAPQGECSCMKIILDY